ncbi:HBR397Wp [Eremothecium sinecaudum]|uniref:HBR397Wp n=1 Tax=Eremothecium sinecaudum TaxID=45286 RepID=A0A109UXJ7_9SACH|nr:HBR397Wp [Eremothecium sinecaudum]AMD19298.1 HBR397Wp [Eremothecium sinecaudum]
MGLFNGNENDKDVTNFNNDVLENKFSKQLTRIDDTLNEIWKDISDEPASFIDDVVKHSTSKAFSDGLIDSIWLNATDTLGEVLTGMGLPGGLGNPLKIKRMLNPETSMYRYTMPTDEQFSRCKDLKGLSVWDTKGWWRCLFPESVVRRNIGTDEDLSKILTREKVENDRSHKFGLFFPDYSGYLSWRSHMLRLTKEKQQREQQERQKRENLLSSTPSTPEDLMAWNHDSSVSSADARGKVMGTSKYSTFNSTDRGQEQIVESRTYFEDGSVAIHSEKKIVPYDGSEPIYETRNEVVGREGQDATKDGWFWKK